MMSSCLRHNAKALSRKREGAKTRRSENAKERKREGEEAKTRRSENAKKRKREGAKTSSLLRFRSVSFPFAHALSHYRAR